MLLIYSAETTISEDERAQCMADSKKLCQEMAAKGQFLGASPLHPVRTATCVRVRAENRLVTDGPFAETTEQLGGYYLIDVAATWGTVEVRPVVEVTGVPKGK
jgi:hypothetical protein